MARKKSERLTLPPSVGADLGAGIGVRVDGLTTLVGNVRQRQHVADGLVYTADVAVPERITGDLYVEDALLALDVTLDPHVTELEWLATL